MWHGGRSLIEDRLKDDPSIRAVFTQATETSTGVIHPIREMAEITGRYEETVIVVDAITGIGALDIPMDAWNLDVLVSGSQKAFMLPPGLSFVALSEKAWRFADRSNLPKYYFDFGKQLESAMKNQSPFTPAITLVIGLRESLRKIRHEGLKAIFARHDLLARATREAVKALGLELFVEESPSNALTAVKIPERIGADEIKSRLFEEFGITVAGGQDQARGKIIRIAHLGYYGPLDMVMVISALEMLLAEMGHRFELGAGVRAAEKVLISLGGGPNGRGKTYRVLVAGKLASKGIEILKGEEKIRCYVEANISPGELRATIREYDGIIIRSKTTVSADIINASERLKVIGRAGIGVDNIDVQAATRRGILVMNTARENAVAAAEHTIAMMLAMSRNIPQANTSTKSGKWEKGKFMGVELYGKTLGIIGIGEIGSLVAERAQGMKMDVVAYDPYISPDAAAQKGIPLVSLDDLLNRSDFISIHTPLTEETGHLIDVEAFERMKTGVMIINCARGGIVDESALLDVLRSGKVRGAALDVFEHEAAGNNPLFDMDNVICTPHIGAATSEAQENVAVAIADQVVDFLINKRIRNAVNIPIVNPDVLPVVQPYLDLGEKLGSFLTQISDFAIEELSIEYKGTVAEHEVSPITVSILRGLLTPYMGEVVNFVNASIIARDRGITVRESKSSSSEDFASMVTITAMGGEERNVVAGALFGTKDFRIVQINDFLIEAVPRGNMLLIHNYDRPGVIGNIGTALGNRNINIATMQFSRERLGGAAISLLHLDSVISKEVMEELSQLPNIISVKHVEL